MAPSRRQLPSGELKWLAVRDTAHDEEMAKAKKAEAAKKRATAKENAKAYPQLFRSTQRQRNRFTASSSARKHKKRSQQSELIDAQDELDARTEQDEAPARIFIQAFDLGTTYSAAAYAVTSEDPDIESVKVVQDWDKAPYRGHTEKAPTAIAFPEDEGNADLEEVEWGYAIGKDRRRTVWFKLLFAASGDPKELDDPLLQQSVGAKLACLPEGRSVEEVLQEMYELLAEKCHKHAREKSGLDNVDEMPTTTLITVPAEYKEIKKSAIREIVERAQVSKSSKHTIKIITECEAVCFKVVHEGRRTGDIRFRTGELTMVLDIGGGSLDVTTCMMSRLSPPQFIEACNPRGAYYGSTAVCRKFLAWCEDLFGPPYRAVPVELRSKESQFMREFEDHMKAFDNSDDTETFQVQLPQLAVKLQQSGFVSHDNYDFGVGSVQFKAAEMRWFFEDLKQAATTLISEQMQELEEIRREHPEKGLSPVNTLILAGGFALCEYVCQVFRDFCNEKGQGRIKLVVADRPWSSVVFGAVLAGLFPHMLKYRTSSRCLGVVVTQAFNDATDKMEDMYMCEVQGRRAKGYIKWLFERGELFRPGQTRKHTVALAVSRGEPAVHFHLNIYTCDEFLDDGKPNRVDDQAVRLFTEAICTFEVPKTLWRNKSGQQVQLVDVTFSVALDSGLGVFKIEAKVGNKLLKDLRYEFEAEQYR